MRNIIKSAWCALAAVGLLLGGPASAQSNRDPSARSLAIKAATTSQARQPRLSIISNGENWQGAQATIATAGQYASARVLHKNLAPCIATGIRVLAANFGNAVSSSDGTSAATKERQNPNTITVMEAIEINGTKTDQSQPRYPATWAGTPTITISPSSASFAFPNLALSDPIAVSIAPGATFYERSAVTVPVNGNGFFSSVSLRGGTTGFGQDTGEGFASNSSVPRAFDGSNTADAAPQFAAAWSALAMLGTCGDGTVAPSIAISGDSISARTDDAGYGYFTGGWPLRAFAAVPHMLLALPGEREFDAINFKDAASRFTASQYATHVLWPYGRNDLSFYMGTSGLSAAATFTNMKATRLQAAKLFMTPRGSGAPGQVFIGATILPAPSSTDGYRTYAAETKDAYEAGRVLFNDWMRDTSAAGFVAQANAQMAGITNAGVARVADPCVGLEVNGAGMLTLDGGYVPILTTTYATGTSSGSNTTNQFNDTTKAWMPGQYRGAELRIISGTGAGQMRSIGGNSATQLLIADAFTTLPDSTSVYEVTDAVGMNGVHPGTRGAILAAGGIPAVTLMAPLPVKISAIEPWWHSNRINPAYRPREVAVG